MEGPVCTVKARATPGNPRSRCPDLEGLRFKGTDLVQAGGVRSRSMLTDDDAAPVARSNSWKEMGSVPRDRVSTEDDAVREFRNHSSAALTDENSTPQPGTSFQKFSERATARATAPQIESVTAGSASAPPPGAR